MRRGSASVGLFVVGLLAGAGVWLGLSALARPKSEGWTPPGRGFVVWESKRSGRWRLWIEGLDGKGLRQLSPATPAASEDAERIHCCPHVAPDGKWIAYLSLDPGPDRYPEKRPETGALRVIRPDGGGQRTLAERVRAYGEHRAAVWRNANALVYIDGEGRTVERSLATGRTVTLVAAPHPRSGWLVDPTLRWATDGAPSFSRYQKATASVVELQAFGGCQPYFTADGRWGFWAAGAGGPLDRIELATREVSEILKKNDPRLPGLQGYLYFPMVSPDRRLLAFAASAGEHDHWKADYDVYVAEIHPDTLELVGPPVRHAPHPAPDRFPAVWLDPVGARPVPARRLPPPRPQVATGAGWPSSADGLLFLWERADAPNQVTDPAGVRRSYPVERHGLARLDRRHRMDLAGGSFVAAPEASAALAAGVKAANEVTLELTLTPGRAEQNGAVAAFSGGGNRANFVLAQEGRELVLRLTVSHGGLAMHRIGLGAVEPGRATHLVATYRPGSLAVYRDGRRAVATREVQGDFFRWRERPLTFGAERGGEGSWLGTLEGIALYGRTLDAAEAAENARRYQGRARGPAITTLRLTGTLVAKSRTPTLAEISPYREALAVYEYRVDQVLAGRYGSDTVRVAQWVLQDGETLSLSARRPGARVELTLQPFAAQKQLESVFLSDTLAKAGAGDLFYDVGR
jgi:hypothetical protein